MNLFAVLIFCTFYSCASFSSLRLLNRHPSLRNNIKEFNDLSVEDSFTAPRSDKKPIGSVPDFALPSDGVEETPIQRATVYLHFTITTILLSKSIYNLSLTSFVDFATVFAVVMSSIILGTYFCLF